MVNFNRFVLPNGLKVLINEDPSTPLAALNILYDVGARDEDPDHTGFAHLFEHLMFGGSENIPNYDEIAQNIGAENNAFTTNDLTNYYLSFPAQNLETALWLESDRMNRLDFSEKSLEVQRQVVIEEFKQRYLNQPYGDVWLKLRPLVYTTHPYRWATIGKEISHIENATLADVESFFYRFYRPNNAILTISGNVKTEEALALVEKYFGDIPAGEPNARNLPQEPAQTEARLLEVVADVPVNAIYRAYPMCSRTHEEFHAADLISDILARGKSGRIKQRLVKELQLFTSANAYITGDIDSGLIIFTGQLAEGTSFEQGEEAMQAVADELRFNAISEYEMEKVKNQAESSHTFGEIGNLNVAMNLAYFELLGDANLVNKELSNYQKVSAEQLRAVAEKVLSPTNCSTLRYRKA